MSQVESKNTQNINPDRELLNWCVLCKSGLFENGTFKKCVKYDRQLPITENCPQFEFDQQKELDQTDDAISFMSRIANFNKVQELSLGTNEKVFNFPIVLKRTFLAQLKELIKLFFPTLVVLIIYGLGLLFKEDVSRVYILMIAAIVPQVYLLYKNFNHTFRCRTALVLDKDSYTIYPNWINLKYTWGVPFNYLVYQNDSKNQYFLAGYGAQFWSIELSNSNHKPEDIQSVFSARGHKSFKDEITSRSTE